MIKDKEKTKEKILNALKTILSTHGFTKIGINLLAKEANIDKVLIYRYFGGLKELITDFAQNSDYWVKLNINENNISKESIKHHFLEIFSFLRENKLTQEILRWELSEQNELTEILAKQREEESVLNIDKIKTLLKISKNFDIEGIISILFGGIVFLLLRSKTINVFNGININSEEGFDRLKKSLIFIIDAVIEKYNKEYEDK